MWAKGLAAAVTEALSSKAADAAVPVASADVERFIQTADRGAATAALITRLGTREVRDAATSLAVFASSVQGVVLHRNYLAK
jgi:hypothetical protein